MAQQLRLKSQKYSAQQVFNYAIDVLVDTGVTHLSHPFTYAVDEKMGELFVGSLVSVPFGAKTLPGIVVSTNTRYVENLKFIRKVIHSNPIVTEEQIELIQLCAERWTGTFWSYLKFVVPNIPARIEISKQFDNGIKRKIEHPELRIGNSFKDLSELIANRVNPSRQLLVVVPDIQHMEFVLHSTNKKFIEYGSHLTAQERVANYTKILSGKSNYILGTRSSIFLPLQPDAEVIIVDDLSFSYFESRFPYWNVRDVALIRTQRHSVTFYTHSPSLELVRLAESKWMRLKQHKTEKSVNHFKNGRIGYQTVIKNGLRSGCVLVLVPERGYINSLVCGKCKNLLTCSSCGGRLIQVAGKKQPICQLCSVDSANSDCRFCGSDFILGFSKGIDRTLEELGRQFPNVPIKKFANELTAVSRGEILVANYSTIPIGNFAAVVALNFEKFGYQNKLRSSEIARKALFDLKALQSKEYFIDSDSGDYFSQVFQSGDSYRSACNELRDRSEVKLPPEYRIAVIEGDSKIESIFTEQPFVDSVSYSQGRALIKCKVADAAKLSDFIQGIANYRSLKKLKPWNVKIDPLDI